MRTLIGIVTFGNLDFTKLTIQSIRETTESNIDFFVVVGKPGDWETKEWLDSQSIAHTMHIENMGFPFSLNDIYDYGWKLNSYTSIIIAGNDIITYPFAIDSMIKQAEETDYEVISALQYDVKSLVSGYPETQRYFSNGNFIFKDFSAKPWEAFKDYTELRQVADMQLYDIQNLCLYKKSVFEKIGYTDVNFFPAYFVDNDYARRIVNAGIKCCTLMNARFFHFWSRTIHQGSGGSTPKYFKNNEEYYRRKWGGVFGKETTHPSINIPSRDGEVEIVRRWRSKG